MLVLTRKIGQQIRIGKGVIQMKILNADNGIIRIGISAPSTIDIDREEVYLKKAINNAFINQQGEAK